MARRRRRKGNPLLIRILVISVAAHAIILPVAAHFGAFEKFKKQFSDSRVVMVSLPPTDVEKPKEAAKTEKKAKTAEKKSGAPAPKSSTEKAGLPQPKVVASTGAADGGGNGASVDANAGGKAGVLPGGKPGGEGGTVKPPEPPPVTPPETKPETTTPKPPEPPPVVPKPPEPPVVVPKAKRIVQAEAVETPEPTIPDDLRTEPFEKTLVVEADVDTGGHPINVKVAESTGVKGLDSVGLDTAKKYRFKPATVDDEPVTQHVRFRIIFKVE